MKKNIINKTVNAHFYNGNIKVGNMLTWNKLAGSGTLNGCKGSCGEYCQSCYNPDDPMNSECYVFKSYRQYKDSIINSHIVNTEAIRKDLKGTFENLDKTLSRRRKAKPIRVHASGEFETAEEICEWMRLAKKHKEWPVYVYTKAFRCMDEALVTMEKEGSPTIISYISKETGISYETIENAYYKYNDELLYGNITHRDVWRQFCADVNKTVDFQVLERHL